MRLAVCIALVPVFFLSWQWWGDHAIESDLRPIASGVAGRPVTVDCQSLWGALLDAQSRSGEVRYDAAGTPEPKLFLTRDTCKRLRAFEGHLHHRELTCLATLDWTSSDPLPFGSPCYAKASRTVYAVLVLAHESYHTAGVVDEAAANCYAIQGMAWTAEHLGAAADEAERIARAMAVLEPVQDAPYGSAECRAGGSLDLHPETAAFPTEHPLAAPAGTGAPLVTPSG